MHQQQTYIALLRGINVGGHHKLPMADLRKEMVKLGFKHVKTLLNTGNIIFDGVAGSENMLEEEIAAHLERVFGFSIPRRSSNLLKPGHSQMLKLPNRFVSILLF